MPEQEKTQSLFVHREQPRVSNVYPNWAALLGVSVILLGCYFVAAAKWMPEVSNRLAMSIAGVNFMLMGGLVAWRTFRGVRLRARAREARGQQPWRYNHNWNIRGADDGGRRRVARGAAAVGGIGLFLVPFHLIIFDEPPGNYNFVLYGIFGLIDLAVLIAFCHVVYMLVRTLIFGQPRIIFQQFPYFTGQIMNLVFSGGRRLANCKDLIAELHCIKEYYEWKDSGGDSSAIHVNESIYKDLLHFSTDAAGMAELKFHLPDDAISTDLISDPNTSPPRPPHYWELVITSARPGIDYEGIFLLPVYRPD